MRVEKQGSPRAAPKLTRRKATIVRAPRPKTPECVDKLLAIGDPQAVACFPIPSDHRNILYRLRQLGELFLEGREENKGDFLHDLINLFDLHESFTDEQRIAGCTALTAAIRLGSPIETIEQICLKGGKRLMDAVDGNRETALTHAVRLGSGELVKLLLKAGAEISKKDGHGRTPLLTAIDLDRGDITADLLSRGVDSSDLTAKETFAWILADPTGRRAIAHSVLQRVYERSNAERQSGAQPTYIRDLVGALWSLRHRLDPTVLAGFIEFATEVADECTLNKFDRKDLVFGLSADKNGRFRNLNLSIGAFERLRCAVNPSAKGKAADEILRSIDGFRLMAAERGGKWKHVAKVVERITDAFLQDISKKIAVEGLAEGEFEALMWIVMHNATDRPSVACHRLSMLFDAIVNLPLSDICKISFGKSESYIKLFLEAGFVPSFAKIVRTRLMKARSTPGDETDLFVGALRLYGRIVDPESNRLISGKGMYASDVSEEIYATAIGVFRRMPVASHSKILQELTPQESSRLLAQIEDPLEMAIRMTGF